MGTYARLHLLRSIFFLKRKSSIGQMGLQFTTVAFSLKRKSSNNKYIRNSDALALADAREDKITWIVTANPVNGMGWPVFSDFRFCHKIPWVVDRWDEIERNRGSSISEMRLKEIHSNNLVFPEFIRLFLCRLWPYAVWRLSGVDPCLLTDRSVGTAKGDFAFQG